MKLNKNTIIPKIMVMKSELEIMKKIISKIVELIHMQDVMGFAKEAEKLINNFPKFDYFDEEMQSIKECLIDLYDGYETREEAISYMKFMERVVENSFEYIKSSF